MLTKIQIIDFQVLNISLIKTLIRRASNCPTVHPIRFCLRFIIIIMFMFIMFCLSFCLSAG